MATLSASRKSSAGSSSPSSPRPSISGALYSAISSHLNDARMTSVHEEDDDVASHQKENHHLSTDKLKDPRSCNERSDSGFSECSNCSTPSASCLCNSTLLDKNHSIIEEKSNSGSSSSRSSSSNEPEETTESIRAEAEGRTAADESFTISSDHDIRSEISSLEYDDAHKSTCDDNQNIVVSIRVPTRRELFQDKHGDLLNEVERRKLSLEKATTKNSSFKHDMSLEKLKKSSKVSLLMEKFETSNCASSIPSYRIQSTVTNGRATGLSTNPLSIDGVNSIGVARTSVVDTNNLSHFNSHFAAKSKSPTRNATNPTTFRLSKSVREVTERLSRPKQPTPNETKSILKQNSGAFVRSNEFWKR